MRNSTSNGVHMLDTIACLTVMHGAESTRHAQTWMHGVGCVLTPGGSKACVQMFVGTCVCDVPHVPRLGWSRLCCVTWVIWRQANQLASHAVTGCRLTPH
jgi:hypothetical protein